MSSGTGKLLAGQRFTPPRASFSTTSGCARWKSCLPWRKSPRHSSSSSFPPPKPLSARPIPSQKPPPQPAQTAERLQKLLAAAGLGSRREIEGWIAAGRVTLNGEVAKLGDRAGPRDVIAVDGKTVRQAAKTAPRVLIYNKPVGELVTREAPGGRPPVFSRLPPGRWVAVGRLDLNSSGLLLFTASGELANRLMHPRYALEREYLARVQGLRRSEERRVGRGGS